MLPISGHDEHMASFNQLDIQLDPFPHTGGVTTLEGLMMGIPCVTLLGERIPGRLSASFLTVLGLEDLVAQSLDEYVEIAVRLAGNLDRLAHERATLRQRLMASPIADAGQYTRAVEDVYRTLWRRWCERRGARDEGRETSDESFVARGLVPRPDLPALRTTAGIDRPVAPVGEKLP
jgi:predicted O-linked N-acetylglucosamine transferase (SPINDLY family)